MPAVVVLHGYLANLGLMEVPWAVDLTHLGCAAAFIDRRGHGRSGGRLWPPESVDTTAGVAAAIASLRRDGRIDSDRIAILGHSDGATAALTEASRDWNVRATIAVSASVAPAYLVNHVAPQNLLLIYGDEDRFVLGDTDRHLIWNATRGMLDGAGELGSFGDGTARKLVRVGGYGHIDVLYSNVTRLEVLGWLRGVFGLRPHSRLSSTRFLPLWVGLAALMVLLLTGAVPPWDMSDVPRVPSRHILTTAKTAWWRLVLFVMVWTLGLVAAPELAPHLKMVPSQQGSVFAAILLAPAATLGATAVLWPGLRRHWLHFRMPARTVFLGGMGGVLRSLLIIVGLSLLTLHHYETRLSSSRAVLLAAYAAIAALAFAAVEVWLGWMRTVARRADVLGLLIVAGVTAALSSLLFARMAALPGELLSAVLCFSAAHRYGHEGVRGSGGVAFEVLLIAWLGAVTSALY